MLLFFFVLVFFGADVTSYFVCPSFRAGCRDTSRENFRINAVSTVEEGTFEREVLDSTVPVIVDFYANWCVPFFS